MDSNPVQRAVDAIGGVPDADRHQGEVLDAPGLAEDGRRADHEVRRAVVRECGLVTVRELAGLEGDKMSATYQVPSPLLGSEPLPLDAA